jgi:SAM-dependent methyltransferase
MNPEPGTPNHQSFRPCPSCGSDKSAVRFTEPPFFIVRCAECSLVFLGNPPGDSASINAYHEGPEPDAALYRADSSDSFLSTLHAMNEIRVRMIRSVKPGGALLDIGCGRGYFIRTASDQGFNATGTDLSERAVEYARRELGVNAETLSLEALAQTGRAYEVITFWHSLEHFDDPVTALKAVRSLLSEGGLCAIEVPNLHSLKFILSKRKWEGGNHPLHHRTFFTGATLRMALEKADFSGIDRIRLDYHVPGRNPVMNTTKKILNRLGLDSFLDLIAFKG